MHLKKMFKSIQIRLHDFILNNLSLCMPILIFLTPKLNSKRVFCIGLPKSGTHSMAKLLQENFNLKGKHEPNASVVLNYILNKDTKSKEAKDFLINREKLMSYQFEASYYLIYFIKHLVDLFPNAYFILTIRDPIDWITSIKNNSIKKSYYKTDKNSFWSKFLKYSFGDLQQDYQYTKDKELIVAKQQLDYYKMHIDKVIKNVPKEKLLIIDTYQINDKIDEISDFIQADRKKTLQKAHVSRNTYDNSLKFSEEAITQIKHICDYFSKAEIKQFDKYKENIPKNIQTK